jgi:hypothetical protein
VFGNQRAHDSSEIHDVTSMRSKRSPDAFSRRCARSFSE